jgi:DNA-binding response OmpR family regulator
MLGTEQAGLRIASTDDFDTEPPTAGRRPRIVVADDDDDVRALVASTLRSDGYDVIEARNGEEVLRCMGTAGRTPDAIVTDVCMPTLSGLSVLGALRADGWLTPVVLLTALRDVSRQAEHLGADVVVGKPFDTDDLRTIVMNLLRPSLGPRAFARTLPDV